MANRRRGEVPLDLGGERLTLCLTLGALAELETALGAPDLAGLAERFAGGRLAARDLIALLGAALRGGGHDIDDAGVARLPLAGGIEAVTGALGEALAAAFGEPAPDPSPDPSPDPCPPREAESRETSPPFRGIPR
ncbi:gene transfer agent family protein [Methylobacterium durans]|uniref:Gene transfer agent family protein n=1 Tax=Methylobacterium durans TaxID=2202825 RepID=A0A2U8WER9_9HYPH|nr:gene transfer agent family protein [Methylobacterium durans]AWN44529.1 gene transfer agent family protein [Methylobacterium durans]